MADEGNNRPRGGAEAKSLVFIGALLVVIVAALAVLWLKERRARIEAEREMASLAGRGGLQQMLGQMLQAPPPMGPLRPGAEAPTGPGPVRREDLYSETVEFKGRSTTVLYIAAEAGRRFGFRGGDVIVVAEEPASLPASPP